MKQIISLSLAFFMTFMSPLSLFAQLSKDQKRIQQNMIFLKTYLDHYTQNKNNPKKFIRNLLKKNEGPEVDFFDNKIIQNKIKSLPPIQINDDTIEFTLDQNVQKFKIIDAKNRLFSLNGKELDLQTNTRLEDQYQLVLEILKKTNQNINSNLNLIIDGLIPRANAALPILLLVIGGVIVVAGVAASAVSGFLNGPYEDIWGALTQVNGLKSATLVNCQDTARSGELILKRIVINSEGQNVLQETSYKFKSVNQAAQKVRPNYYTKTVSYQLLDFQLKPTTPNRYEENQLSKAVYRESQAPHKNVQINSSRNGYTLTYVDQDHKADGTKFPPLMAPRSNNMFKKIDQNDPDWNILNTAYLCCRNGQDCEKNFNKLALDEIQKKKFYPGSSTEIKSPGQR